MISDKLFEVTQPVRVLFGKGQLSNLGDLTAPLGSRVFLLTMGQLVDLGMAERAKALLKEAGLDVVIFDDVQPEPTCAHVDTVAQLIRESGAEVLVALGGGSVIDVAKASAIRATHPDPIWMYVDLSDRPPLPIEPKVLPIVAIPTTAGTGSEVTPYAVISNDETAQKGTIKSPSIFPKVSIVDPDLTLDLPPTVTAHTGADAFAHALEAYLNEARRTPFSDMIAAEAMRVLYRALPQVMKNGHDVSLREQASWGSLLAGIAIANAGTTVAHTLAQPLGARAHLPHGLAVAMFTLPVIRHTCPAAIDRFASLACLLEPAKIAESPIAQQAEGAVKMVESLLSALGMNLKLREYQLPHDIVDLLIEDVFSYMSRPLAQHVKQFSKSEVRAIIEDAM